MPALFVPHRSILHVHLAMEEQLVDWTVDAET